MYLETQFKLKEKSYLSYLRNNSYWYKILNRDPKMISTFEKEVKDYIQKQKTSRISKIVEYIDMFQSIVSNMN